MLINFSMHIWLFMFFFPCDAVLITQDHIKKPHLEAITAIQLADITLSFSVERIMGKKITEHQDKCCAESWQYTHGAFPWDHGGEFNESVQLFIKL
jgi:hypothetical protein